MLRLPFFCLFLFILNGMGSISHAAPPANDLFINRIPITGTYPLSVNGTNREATIEANEPSGYYTGGKSVWWSWTAPATGETVIELTGNLNLLNVRSYTGTHLPTLNLEAGSEYGAGYLNFHATAGTTYQIVVDSIYGMFEGAFTLTILYPATPPANDLFADGIVFSGSHAKISGSNRGATKELGEPNHASTTGGKSVWYRWTAPISGNFNAFIKGKGPFENRTVLALYTGSPVSALNSVGSVGWANPATVAFTATQGTTYHLAVEGHSTSSVASGDFDLLISQPPTNNAFANAIDLGTASSGTSSSWIDYSTNTEVGEVEHPLVSWHLATKRTLWWRWTAPASGYFNFDTLGADFDTELEVYTGSTLNALTLIAENHDANTTGQSRLALNATLGTTYYIRVSGEKLNDIGTVPLQFSQISTPGNIAQHIALGRAYLQQQNTTALADADAQFSAALAIDANHPEANVLKAITGFARLEQGTAFQTALSGLGMIDANLYGGGYRFPEDSNGKRIATPGTHTSYGVDYLVQTVLPALAVIRSHLDKASTTSFETSLSDTETAMRFVKVDAGDVSLIQASTWALEAVIRLLQTYDAGVSIADLITKDNQGALTAESAIQAFGNLLDVTNTDQRSAFKTALQNANAYYQTGSTHVRTLRTNAADPKFLFPLLVKDQPEEAKLSTYAQQVSNSLNGTTTVAGETLNLSQFISSTHTPLRSRISGLHENKAVASTSPDPTFSGTAPAATQARLNSALKKVGLLHEVTGFGNWASHFLKNASPANQAKDADPDGDMLNNFAEFAFNLDPSQPSSPSHYSTSALATNTADNKSYLNLSFKRRIVRTNISYVVAVSDNLTTWDRTQTQVIQVGLPVANADGQTETVQFRVLADPSVTSRKFIRIEVTDLEQP